jgi:DHA3 family tetracycline resistance protein-like MFS transporter
LLLESVIVFRGIFPNRNLFLLWSGQWVSLTGDYVYRIGLYWWVLAMSGSTTKTGLLGACFFLPTLLFGLYAGTFADRRGYRKTMAAADLLRLALVLAVAGAFALGLILRLAASDHRLRRGGGGAFFNPARDALIPELARRHAGADNAAQQSAWPLSLLAGAILARLTIGVRCSCSVSTP